MAVTAHPDDIEDACAFAWIQFFRYQPDRDRNWKGWLYRTAQREAWRLNARHRTERPMLNDTVRFGVDPASVTPDPRDRYEERLDFLAALEELDKLPERLRAVVLVRSQVGTHADVAEVLGISRQRVAFLLQHVTVALRDISERRIEAERPVASPRAARLRELEDNPPTWLVNEIGRNGGRGKNDAGTKLAWRRAALAIDDYRSVSGWDSSSRGIGPTPIDFTARGALQRAERAITQLRGERRRRHGPSRER
jgi:DNA-directed RNA polymerase specialized sigma24 family protein